MNIKQRNYNLDLLRILACFMVIVIHVAANKWYITSTNSFQFLIYNIYDSLVRAAVPLFVMISGVFFLNQKEIETKKLYKTKILKLCVFYFSWNIIYYFFDMFIYKYEFSLYSFLNSVILGYVHLWFIPMIIGLYIISPLLTKITMNSNSKLVKYFIVLFMFGCLMTTIDYCTFLPKYELIHNFISKLPIDIICQYYSYFLLGYYLYNYDFTRLEKKKFLLSGTFIISVLACVCGTWYLSHVNGANTATLYENFSIFTLLETIIIFLFFKKSKFISEKIYADKVATISKDTLGIYAIHIMIMTFLFHYNIITITSFNPILSIPIISAIVFIFGLICVRILRKIKLINKFLI